MKKLRLSALLLAILMVVSMIPAMALSVFAADGEGEATFPEKPATLPGFDIRKWDHSKPNDGTISNAVGIPYTHRNATYTTQTLIDYTTLANDQVVSDTPGKDPIANANGLQIQQATTATLRDGLPAEFAYVWRGGSGLLLAVDTTITGETDIDGAGSGFHIDMIAEVTRASLNGEAPQVSEVVFSSSVNYRAYNTTKGPDGKPYSTPSYYYSYYPEWEDFVCASGQGSLGSGLDQVDADTWMCEVLPNNNARIIDDYKGYFYLPFDYSFFCTGANGEGTYEGPGYYQTATKGTRGDILTFNEAVEVYEDVKIKNISIYTDWSKWSAAFREISVVFVEPEYVGGEDVEVEELEGEVTITAPNTPATLTHNLSMIGADGLRFNIDTSAVNAPVQLRLSMISDIKKNESRWAEDVILGGFEEIPESELTMDPATGLPAIDPETGLPVDEDLFYFVKEVPTEEVDENNEPIKEIVITYPYAKGDAEKKPLFGKNTYVSLTSDEYIKTASRGYDCLIYYFDAEGNPVPLTATDTTDVFAALPQGYVGEIYVPSASFNASITDLLQIGIVNAGVMNFTGIDFEYISEGTGNVVVSDIAVCLTEANVAGVTVGVSDTMSLNVYAYVDDRYEGVSLEVYKDNILVSADVPGYLVEGEEELYKFTVDGLAFTEMNAKFDITLRLNGEKTSTQIKGYSVAKYVKHIVEAEDTPADVKKAYVDLLVYGDAAMKYAAEKNGEAAPETLPTDVLSDDQKALASAADAVLSETATDKIEGEENEDFIWRYADVDFSLGLTIDFRAYLYDEIGYFAYVVDGEDFTVIDSADWGILPTDGLFHIRYANIGIEELANEMTVAFGYDEEATELPADEDLEGQKYTTSVNAILVLIANSNHTTAAARDCAAGLYNLGASFAALMAA